MEQDNEALTQEDRLKAITYQFITLYERWSEDRQIAAKQGADTAELVKKFTEQVNAFKELEPAIRQQIAKSIASVSMEAVKLVGEKVEASASQAIEKAVGKLSKTVLQAERNLAEYQAELQYGHWGTIFIASLTTVVASLLMVWFLMPAPVLPLTSQQIQYLSYGRDVEMVWPKLSKEERQHLADVADKIGKQK